MISKHSELDQAPTGMEKKTLPFHPFAIHQHATQTDACTAAPRVSADWHMKAGKFAAGYEIRRRASQVRAVPVEKETPQ